MNKILSYQIASEEFDRLVEAERKYNGLIKLINANDSRFVTVLMIANAHGISRQEAINRPWMLPNFGITDFQTEGKRKKRFWRYDEYLDWIAIPEHERITEFRALKKR
ncbi:hypothetical protein [Sphaerochaeta globosa]|uniref:Uncharacterized protein n=1 Tax=Sphaerochaeta globosa (strain ATCC BAA-1886 / DSM 22777 / Buddy) TaxID=158189 RepID=F0RWN2_SPHGB|nr:hypothetical protein [Sphaerochaeta globosa]ADY13663.1 hypothetical protein SpiBuddy_1839 [Sphaerochaeta globosa str. Buddy]